jgi:hypothetical protein
MLMKLRSIKRQILKLMISKITTDDNQPSTTGSMVGVIALPVDTPNVY